jgi:hypothetical protein
VELEDQTPPGFGVVGNNLGILRRPMIS